MIPPRSATWRATRTVRPQIEQSPLYSGLGVVKAGRSLFVIDPVVSAAWSWGTVLSLPVAIDGLVAQLAAALPA